MKLTAIDPIRYSGKQYAPGEELDVPETDGKALLDCGAAKLPDAGKRKAKPAHAAPSAGTGHGGSESAATATDATATAEPAAPAADTAQ